MYELPPVYVHEGICTLHLVSCVTFLIGLLEPLFLRRQKPQHTVGTAAHNVLLYIPTMLTKQTWLGSTGLWTVAGTQPNSLRKLKIEWLKEVLFPGSYTCAAAIFLVTVEFQPAPRDVENQTFLFLLNIVFLQQLNSTSLRGIWGKLLMFHMALGFKEFPCNEVLSSGLFPFCFILSRRYSITSSLGQFKFHIRTVGSELKSQREFLSLFFSACVNGNSPLKVKNKCYT